jgi:hypothetical protein
MTIPEIAKKYGISEAYLNSKDDALKIAATSLNDLKAIVLNGASKEDIAAKLQFLADFMLDCKNSNH